MLLAGGFPLALIFAWVLQLASTDSGPERPATGKLDVLFIGTLIAVLGMVSYQQLAPNGTGQQAAIATTASPRPGSISVAVLPFANLSGDASQEFFSDGMTEEIMTALAKVPSLRMVGHESAFQFKDQKADMREVGQALGATYLVEGSVRKAGLVEYWKANGWPDLCRPMGADDFVCD